MPTETPRMTAMKIDVMHDTAVSPNIRNEKDVACAFPVTQVLDDGSAACVYRRGKEKHSYDGVLDLQRSSDQGRTWSEPQPVVDMRDAGKSAMTGGVCQTAGGDMLINACLVDANGTNDYVFSAQGRELKRWFYTLRSSDRGRTWGEVEPFSPAPFDFAGIITSPTVLPDRTIFMPHSVKTPHGPLGTAARLSHNDGGTFDPLFMCLQDTRGELNFCDSYFTVLPNGELLALIWSFRHDNQQSVNLHRSVSRDGGRNWSPPVDTGVPGETCAPLALSTGEVLVATSYRHRPQGIRLYRSCNGGDTWEVNHPVQLWDAASERVTGRAVAEASQALQADEKDIWEALPGYSFGTPNLVALDDGSLLLVYYATKKSTFHVRACRFRVIA